MVNGQWQAVSTKRKAVILISLARGYALDLDMSVKGLFVVPKNRRWKDAEH